MSTQLKAITIYLDPAVYEKLRQAANIEERTVSKMAARILAEKLFRTDDKQAANDKQVDLTVADEVEERARGRQVDLEELIAVSKKKRPRRKRR